eukprot:TRINITY_DN4083_c0_g1_i1.p1 TRINITY_DN4083_c0_g1~~TRINITY_DN4083_c0_g1_i1.p1  ORF type:complete len:200 (-),score=71.79 TRINITY_DN4083_c0_g1_i1:86-661(-)
MNVQKKNHKQLGEKTWGQVEKINSELFCLTYGAIVSQLLNDFEDVDQTNKQLEQMGYNIGKRIIDEFMATSGSGRCKDFEETAKVVAKVGFKMFLGITANIVKKDWNKEKTDFILQIDENPLIPFVELPEESKDLKYCNMLCGVLRGALEMVQMRVECELIKDKLKGDDTTQIKVVLLEKLNDEIPVGEDD